MARYDVLVTGGSSPLGDHAIPALLAAGRSVAAIARSTEAAAHLSRHGVEVIHHDLTCGGTTDGVRVDALAHLAGIRLAGGAARLAQDVGAERIVVVSSASATAPGHPDREELVAAEQQLQALRDEVSILRPTMIYGSARDRNVRRLYRLAGRLRRVPRLSGGGMIMPVLVDDLSKAIVEVIDGEDAGVRPVGGPEPVRIGELLDAVCIAAGFPRLPITVPVGPAARAARAKRNPTKFVHAIQMLTDDRVVETPRDVGFKYQPTSLRDGVRVAVSRYASSPS